MMTMDGNATNKANTANCAHKNG
ncbi:MAG: hypothetical protein RLZZ239_1051, partial [Pseudomonadota bacterium]